MFGSGLSLYDGNNRQRIYAVQLILPPWPQCYVSQIIERLFSLHRVEANYTVAV